MAQLKIDLLGTSFTIQSNEEKDYLEKLLAYFKKISDDVAHIPSVKSPLQNSILTGIMLADELYKEKLNVERLQSGQDIDLSDLTSHSEGIENSMDAAEINQRTSNMIDKINEVLK